MLGHKPNFNTFKRAEIIQSMFSNHNGIKLVINNKKIKSAVSRNILQATCVILNVLLATFFKVKRNRWT